MNEEHYALKRHNREYPNNVPFYTHQDIDRISKRRYELEVEKNLKEKEEEMTTLEAQHEVITDLILENKKLKRERDEARADRDIARLAALDSDCSHDRMVGELEKRYKERDEAREEVDRYREKLDLSPLHWEV
jgi:hypothetical protein